MTPEELIALLFGIGIGFVISTAVNAERARKDAQLLRWAERAIEDNRAYLAKSNAEWMELRDKYRELARSTRKTS